MKKCFKCFVAQPLTEFYKHKAMGDGHLNKCKTCTRADVMQHREDNIERVREYDRNRPNKQQRSLESQVYQRTPSGKEAHARAGVNYTARYPKKRYAVTSVGNAVRDGKLIRPDSCEVCQTFCTPHGHHDDYDLPLQVRWLCVPCHVAWHLVNTPLNGT